nr:hypothetical protein [uncultured Cohaesibacter sp.]
MNNATKFDIEALAVPTEDDVSAWNALTREQQLQVMQEVSDHADSTTPCGRTMDDIRASLRSRRQQQARA